MKGTTIVDLIGVSKGYCLSAGIVKALDNVSLKLYEGDFIAIYGPSGSGKSTLIHLIGGLDIPSSGKILVRGWDLSQLRPDKLARYRNKEIGFIFQSFYLQPIYTALENVCLPLIFAEVPIKERVERARAFLEEVGLRHRLYHKPTELSVGEQQRVCIARALVNHPSVILADEPTGNLDKKTGESILELLKRLNEERGVTLIVVTHDPRVSSYAHKEFGLEDGLMVAGKYL